MANVKSEIFLKIYFIVKMYISVYERDNDVFGCDVASAFFERLLLL
jgi:hypothetical protein